MALGHRRAGQVARIRHGSRILLWKRPALGEQCLLSNDIEIGSGKKRQEWYRQIVPNRHFVYNFTWHLTVEDEYVDPDEVNRDDVS